MTTLTVTDPAGIIHAATEGPGILCSAAQEAFSGLIGRYRRSSWAPVNCADCLLRIATDPNIRTEAAA